MFHPSLTTYVNTVLFILGGHLAKNIVKILFISKFTREFKYNC